MRIFSFALGIATAVLTALPNATASVIRSDDKTPNLLDPVGAVEPRAQVDFEAWTGPNFTGARRVLTVSPANRNCFVMSPRNEHGHYPLLRSYRFDPYLECFMYFYQFCGSELRSTLPQYTSDIHESFIHFNGLVSVGCQFRPGWEHGKAKP